jgi:hypothetical protein
MLPGFEPPLVSARGQITDAGMNWGLALHILCGGLSAVLTIGALGCAPISIHAPLLLFVAAIVSFVALGWALPFPGMTLVGGIAWFVVSSITLGVWFNAHSRPPTGEGGALAGVVLSFVASMPGVASGWLACSVRRRRRPLVPRGDLCEHCGYQTGRVPICPECGRDPSGS